MARIIAPKSIQIVDTNLSADDKAKGMHIFKVNALVLGETTKDGKAIWVDALHKFSKTSEFARKLKDAKQANNDKEFLNPETELAALKVEINEVINKDSGVVTYFINPATGSSDAELDAIFE